MQECKRILTTRHWECWQCMTRAKCEKEQEDADSVAHPDEGWRKATIRWCCPKLIMTAAICVVTALSSFVFLLLWAIIHQHTESFNRVGFDWSKLIRRHECNWLKWELIHYSTVFWISCDKHGGGKCFLLILFFSSVSANCFARCWL